MPVSPLSLFLLAAAAPPADPCAIRPEECIVVADLKDPAVITVAASRTPIALEAAGISISQINLSQIRALGLPLVKDYLTLAPGVSVSQTGPLGAQTQVRIRGAEANHSITFIDGIEMNDPASSGEFRMETLLSAGVDRIEVLRGPQSALWGSQAIGGVISVTTRAPAVGTLLYGEAEGGSLGTLRGGIGGGWAGKAVVLSAQLSGLSTRGYDIARSGGDKDGHENVTAHGRLVWTATPALTLSLVGRHQDSRSRFDDFDYGAGVPLDAPLSTRSRQTALRAEAALSLLDGRWITRASLFGIRTANINRTDGRFENQSNGARDVLRLQSTGLFDALGARHSLTAALDRTRERFTNRDADPAALSNQRQRRGQTSLVGEYRLTLPSGLAAGAAVRHDGNDRFADATSVRFDAVAPIGDVQLHAAYGTGIANPSFYDQFGFFPGFFVGNPNLRPERSRSVEAGVRWSDGPNSIDITLFSANLKDEIVGTYDFATFLSGVANASGTSRRRGVEVSGNARLADGLTLRATYAWLDASQQQVAGGAQVKEVRRPPHSGSIGLYYSGERLELAASAAITGARGDTDFARFVPVTLPAYTIVTLSGAWHINDRIDLTARIENALDARQVDVFAYRGSGITAHAGVRFRL